MYTGEFFIPKPVCACSVTHSSGSRGCGSHSGVSLMVAHVCVTGKAVEVNRRITFLPGTKDTSLVWQASGIRHARSIHRALDRRNA